MKSFVAKTMNEFDCDDVVVGATFVAVVVVVFHDVGHDVTAE